MDVNLKKELDCYATLNAKLKPHIENKWHTNKIRSSWGRLAQWKNTPFVKFFLFKGPQFKSPVSQDFFERIIPLIHNFELSKYVDENLATLKHGTTESSCDALTE